ncbi:MAG: hypothetical protein V3T59_02665 [Desulfobacterales bacterium]
MNEKGIHILNRKILKLLAQSAAFAVDRYFQELLSIDDGRIGAVFSVQTYGKIFL